MFLIFFNINILPLISFCLQKRALGHYKNRHKGEETYELDDELANETTYYLENGKHKNFLLNKNAVPANVTYVLLDILNVESCIMLLNNI